MKNEALYDLDFYEWTQKVACDLRSNRLSDAEREHVAEEIEDVGKRDQREVMSRLRVLIAHLIKWSMQPKLRNGSTWRDTIDEQRIQLTGIFEQSPSLRRFAESNMDKIASMAGRLARREMGTSSMPVLAGRLTLDQVLDQDYLPEENLFT